MINYHVVVATDNHFALYLVLVNRETFRGSRPTLAGFWLYPRVIPLLRNLFLFIILICWRRFLFTYFVFSLSSWQDHVYQHIVSSKSWLQRWVLAPCNVDGSGFEGKSGSCHYTNVSDAHTGIFFFRRENTFLLTYQNTRCHYTEYHSMNIYSDKNLKTFRNNQENVFSKEWFKVVQIWPAQTVTCLHKNSPGHIWTTLYDSNE